MYDNTICELGKLYTNIGDDICGFSWHKVGNF